MYLSFRCDYWFRGELHICCLQDGVLLQDVLLRLVMSEGLQSKDMQRCDGNQQQVGRKVDQVTQSQMFNRLESSFYVSQCLEVLN